MLDIFLSLDPPPKSSQPVVTGVAFPRGKVFPRHLKYLVLYNEEDNIKEPCQWTPLIFWPDGSIKWALLEFIGEKISYRLKEGISCQTSIAKIYESSKTWKIELQSKIFLLSKNKPHLLGPDLEASWYIFNAGRKQVEFQVKETNVETGPLRVTFTRHGHCFLKRNKKVLWWERITFYGNKPWTKIEFTIRNPHRSKHRGGYWDLGDPGSSFLTSLFWKFKIKTPSNIFLKICPDEPWLNIKSFELYQESSGGEKWCSRNHVNRNGEIPLTFCGFRLKRGDALSFGRRANPALFFETDSGPLALAFPHFWQNFPKALSWKENKGSFSLYPEDFPDLHEIQGGEQKTHHFWLLYETERNELNWCFEPSRVVIDPGYLKETGALFFFSLPSEDEPAFQRVTRYALEGEASFFRKREIIDEYGWRNFGDVYADHENAFNQKDKPIISHYNNQYDLVYSFLIQFLRSGDPRWFRLGEELARHVCDIDVYHTEEDKPAYNNGLFWHTFHYVDAYRSTHRCYSKDAGITGGGPSNEHLYSSGLLLFYALTGDPWAREVVINFGDHVIEMDGPLPLLRWLDKGPSGLASQTRDPWYHGPGRGAGNSINCLLDAYLLTYQTKYLQKAEELIRRCIHPKDDPEALGLRHPEERWSYTVFLQVLGKYLFLKQELEEFDFMFFYARASLLHYARWMAENEYIYLDKPELLEYPTETWAAQELRKAEVFNLAAYFSENREERGKFKKKARFFYEEGLKRLYSFPTWTYTRPLAIILQSGFSYAWFRKNKPPAWPENTYDFGEPQKFVPQKLRVKQKLLDWLKILKRV